MSALEALEEHAKEFTEATGIAVELIEEGNRIFVILKQVPLPAGLMVSATEALFITDKQYPLSAMDMFWTSVDVVWSNGTVPKSAESIETYLGRKWRRFSWHTNGAVSGPSRNRLLDHFAFMEARWEAEKRP
jgi:hypothetical protein